MGILYLVATPIGNLEDMTLRALRVLKQASLIAAEDTRTARNLLVHFEISTPVTSYFEHNKLRKLDVILDALERGDVAMISEAGMPGLSDPGYELVRAAIARNVRVVPIPGASAVTTALVASGLATDQFVYLGFLPRQPAARRKLLEAVANQPRTLVAFEAPHRVRASLDDIERILGDRDICIARELTKVYEEFFRGSASRARERFAATAPRGEFVFVIGGMAEAKGAGSRNGANRGASSESKEWSDARVRKQVRKLIAAGVPRTRAVKEVARQSGRDRRKVYRLTAQDDAG